MKKANQVFLEAAITLAHGLECNGILLSAEGIDDYATLKALAGETKVVLIAHDDAAFHDAYQASLDVLRLPTAALHRTTQIKVAVLLGLTAGLLQEEDRLVCVVGAADSEFLDTVLVLDINEEPEILTSRGVPLVNGAVRPAILQSLLSLSLEIAREGREGRSVGALFVLGDHDKVGAETPA